MTVTLTPNPKVICEIGCGNMNECRSAQTWYNSSIKHLLFEPNKKFYNDIVKRSGMLDNVYIYNCAILDEEKEVELVDLGSCGHIKGYKSPQISKGESAIEKIQAFPIKYFDKGDIDLLYIDTEGTEYFALLTLYSRPAAINIEMEIKQNNYKNPYFDEIMQWMLMNRYKKIKEIENDYLFIKEEYLSK